MFRLITFLTNPRQNNEKNNCDYRGIHCFNKQK